MRQSILNSGIDPQRIDQRARHVLERLRRAGFDAWLVGGAVRDLLLNRQPKDFDIATDAWPEEICALFPRARVVGRRFRIVHVHHGRHVTEVSTYRTSDDKSSARIAHSTQDLRSQKRAKSLDGVLLRDNAWGNQEEDALRRDFTVNAFYYDPFKQELVDFCNGYKDLERKSLCLIGEPAKRLTEDPVRILRAIRIAAKLGLSIAPDTARAMRSHFGMMVNVSPRRTYDECIKLFMNGHGEASWELAADFGLTDQLFPTPHERHSALVVKALGDSDVRVRENRPTTFAFLLSVLYFHDYQHMFDSLEAETNFELRHNESCSYALAAPTEVMTIPRHASLFVRDVWALQSRLESRRKPKRTLAFERFRASFDLLVLRAETGAVERELCDWWQQLQETANVDAMQLPSRGHTHDRGHWRPSRSAKSRRSQAVRRMQVQS